MKTILRPVGAVVAGIVVVVLLFVAVELFSSVVHPFPEGFNQESHEELCRHVANYPPWVLAACVPMWAFIGFAGPWTAGRLGNRGCALFVGALWSAMVIFNVSILPYPMWFKVGMPIAVVAAVYFAFRTTPPRPASSPVESASF